MTAVIHINGQIGTEANLLGVIRQFKSFNKPTEVEVHIDSNGGSVDEGMSIFNYLRGLQLPITTKASRAYSIAASIFMAGDVRLLEEGANRMMIHMPWGQVQGGSKTLDAASAQLKEIEKEFAGFYSKYTNVDEGSIKRLLENETFLSASEAKDLGLATGTYAKLQAVAFYENNNKIKDNSIMTKAEKFIQAFADFLEGKKEEKIEAVALVLKDANGVDINFPDLDENEQPEIGSKVEGREDGEILMPDGSKILVEGGAVKEIVEATEEVQEEIQEEIQEQAEEGKVETTEEVKAETEEKEEEVDFTAMFAEFETKILAQVEEKHKEEKEKLNAEILALKKEVGSTIENEPTVNIKNKNSQSGNYLTNALRKKQSK